MKRILFCILLTCFSVLRADGLSGRLVELIEDRDHAIKWFDDAALVFNEERVFFIDSEIVVLSDKGDEICLPFLSVDSSEYCLARETLVDWAISDFVIFCKTAEEWQEEGKEHAWRAAKEAGKGVVEAGLSAVAFSEGHVKTAVVEGGLAAESFYESYQELKKSVECFENARIERENEISYEDQNWDPESVDSWDREY